MKSENTITESEYVVSSFKATFEYYKDQPMALYGLGSNTKLILDNIKGYNIIGLMDAERVGERVMGYNVLSCSEAATQVKIIVIVARCNVVGIIYERIKNLEKEHHIAIYDINGNSPMEIISEVSAVNIPYWDTSEDQLRRLIDKHDIISFDIFDTLIMRKILRPQNIFDVVQRRLAEEHKITINFKQARIEAEQFLADRGENADICRIYAIIQQMLEIDDVLRDCAMKLEFDTEMRYVTPRCKMVEIFCYALACNKKVYLLSDMYWGRIWMEQLLTCCGITGYADVLISCDLKKSKQSGALYDYYSKMFGSDRLLHIGDNPVADIAMAQKSRIDTFLVLSGYEILMVSPLKHLLVNVKTIEEYNILGLFVAKFLNDPFSLCASRGKPVFDDLFSMGYLCIAPIFLSFMAWLMQALQKHRCDKMLFSSRDGYLIHQLYMMLKDNANHLPEGVYFKTSRRAATVAAIRHEEDILLLLKKPCKCTLGDLLRFRFGIVPDNTDSLASDAVVSTSDGDKIKQYILSHKGKIIKNAADERKCYLEYIQGLGLEKCHRIGIFDLVSSGTTQYFLSKIMRRELQGFYLATANLPNDFYNKEDILSFLGNSLFLYAPANNICRYYLLLEAVLMDSHGPLICCGTSGKFYYEDESVRSHKFDNILECHNGIKSFFTDILNLDSDILLRNIDIKVNDELYGMLFLKKCVVAENIKNTFYLENKYDFSDEYKVWDQLC